MPAKYGSTWNAPGSQCGRTDRIEKSVVINDLTCALHAPVPGDPLVALQAPDARPVVVLLRAVRRVPALAGAVLAVFAEQPVFVPARVAATLLPASARLCRPHCGLN